ncbi:hypothetical protein [Caballeronia sp. SBC2]|uniref:hypothetical protein n=1 Tax=Caballeronia sp. SBC2 TaxID=2705547 RepID=UPI0013E19D4F|nr:hypothetical protein [Caballeronia sp. SBC2]QIE22936.1 hypothetical protein SBC2_09490 [Caballeronia sp. SBC2]
MPTLDGVILTNWPAPGTTKEMKTYPPENREPAEFSAEFLANDRIRVMYGKNARKLVPKKVLDQLAEAHSGALVPFSGAGSVDEWLTSENTDHFFCKTHLQSYVCPLFVLLGYAVREGQQLRFKQS